MQTIADLLQPFFAARVQGKEATRQARDALNRETFDRKVQEIRDRQAEERRKREANLKIGLDLLGSGYAPQAAFQPWMDKPQSLSLLPDLRPSAAKFGSAFGGMNDFERSMTLAGVPLDKVLPFMAQRFQQERESAARMKETQAELSAKYGSGGGASGLPYDKQYQVGDVSDALFFTSPVGRSMMQNIGQLRSKSQELGKQLAPFYSKQAEFGGLGGIEGARMDSLSAQKSAVDSLLQNALSDSAGYMSAGLRVPNFYPQVMPQIQAQDDALIRQLAQDGLTEEELVQAGFSTDRAKEIMSQYSNAANRP